MPSMADYAKSGGYAKDSKISKGLNNGGSVGPSKSNGGSSGGYMSTPKAGGSSSSSNQGGYVTPGKATGGGNPGTGGYMKVGVGGKVNGYTPAPYQGLQRYNPDAAYQDRLNFFKGDSFEAKKEIAIVKDMYEKEKAAGASAQRLSEISGWADQVRGVAGIGADDPYYGNNANIAPDQQAANTKQVLDQIMGLDKAKFEQKNQAPGAAEDLGKKYEDMLNSYMKQYQEQLNQMKIAEAQKAEMMKKEREKKKQQMLGNFKSQYDAALQVQKGDLDSARSQSEAELRKAYDDAVKNGEMSVREANEAFSAHKSQLDAEKYQASQSRNLLASQRGIGNSQQLLGMETTDNSNFNQLASSAQTSRDKQLADIKGRLDSMNNLKNSETQRINEQYNANLNKAKGQADLAYNTAVNNVNIDDMNADRNFSEQLMLSNRAMDMGALNAQMGGMNNIMQQMMGSDLQSRQMNQQLGNAIQLANNGNMNQLNALAKQHGYDMEKMSAANGYDMQKLSSSQEFQKMMGEIQQGYTQDNMGLQQGYTQDNMGLKFGYDTSLQNNQFGHQQSLNAAAQANQRQMAQDKMNADMQRSKSEYADAVNRELAKYEPGTNEYRIRESQMKDAQQARERDIAQKFANEAKISQVTTNPYLPSAQSDMNIMGQIAPPSTFTLNPFDSSFWKGLVGFPTPSASSLTEQQKKIQAYERYQQLMNGQLP